MKRRRGGSSLDESVVAPITGAIMISGSAESLAADRMRIKYSPKKKKTEERCPTCGLKIVIVPCVKCRIKSKAKKPNA